MRTLVYKRTHNGDPDEQGRFGIHDCMGSVRGWNYEAVIGVGGTGHEPREWGIAGKINWVGIGPHKQPGTPRGPLVTFEHFLYLGERGPNLTDYAPALAQHIYGMNVRTLMNFTPKEREEVNRILAMATDGPPSPFEGESSRKSASRCRPAPEPSVQRAKRGRC